MKVSTFGKATISLAAAATMGFGLFVPAANAATGPLTANEEDPAVSAIGANTLVGVGSDTIQDVEYGISQDLGSTPDGTLNLASWTATGTTPITYRSGGKPAAHPNGSGAGYKAIKESIGMSSASTDAVAAGDVDYARASGTQGHKVTGLAGALTEIPFAIDTISFAAPSGSPFYSTNGGKGLTVADLANIYSGQFNEIDATDTATRGTLAKETVAGTLDAGYIPIQAFLPQFNSGSRNFFVGQLQKVSAGSSIVDANIPTTPPTANQPYVGSGMPGSTSAQVQEHDASVLAAAAASDGNVAAITPFSGAKFIGYHNGLIADPSPLTAGASGASGYNLVPFDYTNSGAVAATAGTAELPYTDNSGTYVPNVGYQTNGGEGNALLWRHVYNIVATRAIQNPNASVKNRALYDTFAGAGSKFCLDSATIQKYGFIKDPTCGDTSATYNQDKNDATSSGYSTATILSPTITGAVAGRTATFVFPVTSNWNGGGSLAVTINGKAYTTTVAAGSTTAAPIAVPTPAAGTFQYGTGANDGFAPNLDGVGFAPVNPTPATPLTYSVAKATATVSASAPRVSHLRVGTVTVKVAAPGLHPTGTVTVYVKTTRGVLKVALSGKAINASTGAVTLSLGKVLPAGSYYVWVSYSGNANINAKALARLAVLSVY